MAKFYTGTQIGLYFGKLTYKEEPECIAQNFIPAEQAVKEKEILKLKVQDKTVYIQQQSYVIRIIVKSKTRISKYMYVDGKLMAYNYKNKCWRLSKNKFVRSIISSLMF